MWLAHASGPDAAARDAGLAGLGFDVVRPTLAQDGSRESLRAALQAHLRDVCGFVAVTAVGVGAAAAAAIELAQRFPGWVRQLVLQPDGAALTVAGDEHATPTWVLDDGAFARAHGASFSRLVCRPLAAGADPTRRASALLGTLHFEARAVPVPPGGSTALVALGSNLGCREAHLAHACARLRSHPEIGNLGVSRVYETAPVGPGDQGRYLNAAVRFETLLPPEALLDLLLEIEGERGRERSVRNAARTLDLDLLFYDTARFRTPRLEVPHPRLAERGFVLEPLCDLEPERRLADGETIAERAAALRDPAAVRVRAA